MRRSPAPQFLLLAWAFFLALKPVPLFADDIQPDVPEATFEDQVVVSASGRAQRLAEVPVHLQVIERKDVEKLMARTLADAMEWTLGLRVESNCQNCNESKIRLLGMEGPYTQILVDGQPTVSSLALVYGVEQLPARMFDSIEVIKGGGSARYGAGAVAGVINLLPHRPSHRHLEVEARGGSMNGAMGSASTSTLLAMLDGQFDGQLDHQPDDGLDGGTWSVFGQVDDGDAVDIDGDGFSDVARRELATLGLRLEHTFLRQAAQLAVDASWVEASRRGGDRLHLPPEQAEIAEAIDTERAGLSVSWLHAPSANFDYRALLSYADTERDSYYGTGMDPNAYGSTDNPLTVADVQLFHHFRGSTADDSGSTHSLTWGLQYRRDQIRDEQPGYGRFLHEDYREWAIFVQDDHRPSDNVSLTYGLRIDDHSAIAGDAIVSPRLAALWSLRPELTLRASVSRGFRPPVVFDEDLHIALVGGGDVQVVRNAPDLEAERSTSALLSLEWRPRVRLGGDRGSSAYLELNAFQHRLQDLFHLVETDDPSTPEVEWTRTNFAGARIRGIELAGGLRFGPRLGVDAGFVWQTSRFDQAEPEFGSVDFWRTPERYGLLTLVWSPTLGSLGLGQLGLGGDIDVFFGLQYTGPMLAPHYLRFASVAGAPGEGMDEDRLERTPSFLTADLNIAREFALPGAHADDRRFTVTLGLRNLTNEFQDDLDRGPLRDSAYVYGPRFPRTVSLAIKLDW